MRALIREKHFFFGRATLDLPKNLSHLHPNRPSDQLSPRTPRRTLLQTAAAPLRTRERNADRPNRGQKRYRDGHHSQPVANNPPSHHP